MKYPTVLLFFIVLFSACQKEKNVDASPPPDRVLLGRYVGTFNRSGMDTVAVSILFKDSGHFEGTSEREKYPAICNGSFSSSNTSVSFSDSCTWTADFDWTLVLNGTYNINYKDERTVRISRTNGTVVDEYLVAKAE